MDRWKRISELEKHICHDNNLEVNLNEKKRQLSDYEKIVVKNVQQARHNERHIKAMNLSIRIREARVKRITEDANTVEKELEITSAERDELTILLTESRLEAEFQRKTVENREVSIAQHRIKA